MRNTLFTRSEKNTILKLTELRHTNINLFESSADFYNNIYRSSHGFEY